MIDDERDETIEGTIHTRRLYRSRENRMIAGVAGGLAQYFNVDPVLIRVGIVLAVLATGGAGLIAYLVMAVIVPQRALGEMDALLDDTPVDGRRNSALVGYALVGIGLFVLVSNLGLLRIFDWGRVWPIAVIGIGVLLLMKRNRD